MHHGSVLSSFLYTVVVDGLTEFAREGALSEFLHADDVVLMSDSMEGVMKLWISLLWHAVFIGMVMC